MRVRAHRGVTWLAALVIAAAAGAVGCQGPEERAADHIATAERLLAAPKGLIDIREAALELRNAVTLTPNDATANALLGSALLRLGVVEEARLYLEEATSLEPGNDAFAIDLARALLFTDPDRAGEIAAGVLGRSPDDVDALFVAAEADALRGDHASAMRRLAIAEAQAPGQPEVEWARARVFESRIRALRLKPGRTIFDPRDFQAVTDAYDAYIAKGGTDVATALFAKAKALTGWRGHGAEAMAQFRAAVDAAGDDHAAASNILDSMATFARARGDRASLLYALERLTEIEPQRVDYWEELIQVARGGGQPTEPILESLLEVAGDDPRAHVVYARALRVDQGLTPAIEHLRSRVDAGDDAAVLLAQMVQMQTQGGRPADGARTLEELQRKHPDDIQTRLLLARRALMADEPRKALHAIEAIAVETGQPEALRVLALAQERLGLLEDALATTEQLIQKSNQFDASIWAQKAELLRRLGKPLEALAALKRLDWGDELTGEQELLRARCEYDLDRRAAGRQRLIDLLEEPNPPRAAAIELYRRERDHPPTLHTARVALASAYERAPDDFAVFEALTDVELALGQLNFSAMRVNNALERRPRDPRLHALRARVMLALGNAKAARADAERALALTPGRGDEALSILLALAEASANPQVVIEMLESQKAKGRLTIHRKVVLGRLLAREGRAREGLDIFEEALAEGAQFTMLKADTAYLLVALGGDLDRAEQLAREAVATPGEQVAAADVLGVVYMAKGLPDAAMYQFSFAADHARPPNADYLLHLGQALERMNRPEKARDAYARALEIDPKHADSRAALAALDGADPAPRTDPS